MSLTSSKLCATLALMGLGASLATADSVINSFEILPLLNPPANNPPYTNVSQSTAAGVTDGTYSMEVVYGPAVSGQNWMYTAGPAGNNTYDAATYMKWRTHNTFKLDVHRPALDFSPDQTGWNLEVYVALSGSQGWAQKQMLPWVWLNNGVATNQTLTWDYSALREAAPVTGSYFQLVLSAKSTYGGVYHGGTVYFDNARFTDLTDIGFTFPTNSSGGELHGWVPQSWGTAPAAAYWDPVDANTNAASGSMNCWCYFELADTNQTAVFQAWNFGPDLKEYGTLGFDVKVDGLNSAATSAGDFGDVQVVVRGNDINWTPIGTFNIPASATNSFVHYEVPLYQPLPTNMVGMNLIFGATNFQGPVYYYVDNILFLVDTNPPALVMDPALPGLELNACAAEADQQQGIRTKDGTYNWVGRPGTVTYAMTINEGLSAEAAGMSAYMFLIGTGNPDPAVHADWYETNGLFLEIQQQAGGLCSAALTYKTNAPESNGIRYTPDGVLAILSNAPMVGTWSLALNLSGNASQASLSAPGGASTSFTLPAGLVQAFTGSPAFAYLGVQPNEAANFNRYVNLAGVQISGVASPLNEVFTGQSTLNTNVFVVSADNPAGVQMRPTNTVYRLSWDAPASGFALYSATALAGSWSSPGLPAILARERYVTFLPVTALPSGGAGYFRLQQQP